nr:hypothetical protein [Pseudomonadales bacterium]
VGVGVVRSLELNRTSTRRDKVVILLSDGEPFCGGVNTAAQARDQINAANWDSQKISTIGVNTGTNGSLFLQQVANENGGTYTESN